MFKLWELNVILSKTFIYVILWEYFLPYDRVKSCTELSKSGYLFAQDL